MQNSTNHSGDRYSFPQKVWIASGIVAFVMLVLLFLQTTFSVLLLVLAGALIAVFFRGLSALLRRKTGWKEGLCLAFSVIGTLLLVALLFWLIGARVQEQAVQLSDTLPATVSKAKAQLAQNPFGHKLLQKLSSPGTQKKFQAVVQGFFRSTFGILGDLYVVLFLGIFFTVSSKIYTKGLVRLLPVAAQETAQNVLDKIGQNLLKWLKGKLFAMLVVFVLTAVGLVLMGVPMWLVLAIIAGLLNFIPNFGPLIAMVPAVLVALMQDFTTALMVAGLYILVQVAESNFITPSVQKKLINIPPALIILAQLFISPFTGGWGLVLATPLMVIIMVLVQELYLKREKKNG